MKLSEDTNYRMAALEANVKSLEAKVDKLTAALLEKSPTGEPPLIDRIVRGVVVMERASWLGKGGVWLIVGLAGTLVTINNGFDAVKGLFK